MITRTHIRAAAMLLAALALRIEAGQVYDAKKLVFLPSDNGADTRAFQPVKVTPELLEIDFTDQGKADNYLHLNFGEIDLSPYLPDGYLEVDAEIDKPILRLNPSMAEPGNFWPTRVFVEQEMKMKPGRHTYRFYFDTLLPKRVAVRRDNLYLFLHDMGGESNGKAKFILHGTRLVKSAPNFREEKNRTYRAQYNWRNYPELGQFYRGKYDLLVPAEAVEGNPFVTRTSLDGTFEKAYLGDITWKYDRLADASFADPDTKLANASAVTVPEKPVPDRKGGYYIYRRDFRFEPKAGEKVYLKIGDLADTAELYLNGRRIGTQSSVRKRHEWVLENGSRQSNTWGKPIGEVVKFQHFERMAISCPFDPADLPKGEVMMLPIYTGEYPWNYVFDVTDALKPGENTLAIRLYNNPVRGYWVYRYTEDRTFRNESGIFGSVELLTEPRPAFVRADAPVAGKVGVDGGVERTFSGKVAAGTKRVVLTGEGRKVELPVGADGEYKGMLTLPADFKRHAFTLTALDAEGRATDSRNVEFNGSVIELRDGKLYVNGDQFVIRGINAGTGIEWNNDRRQTRREWLRTLAGYKQLGFNALRIESATPQQLDDALDYGLLVMPIYAAGSCNTSEVALGNLANPDHAFNTDAHREMAIELAQHPNLLFWNSGNENHHTAGYNDKVLMDEYLTAAQAALHAFDPDRRPVTYANLDTFGTYWFFTAGQSVLGYNSYLFPADFRRMMAAIYDETKMPMVFCEWGLTENETKGTALRKADVAKWEKLMEEKLAILRDAPGCVGGFLYAHHGELNDVRGREWLQKELASFRLTRENGALKFENQDVCTLRKVLVQVVSPDDVVASEWLDELKPGQSLRISCPSGNPDALRVEIRFETHRGLKEKYIRMLNRVEEATVPAFPKREL